METTVVDPNKEELKKRRGRPPKVRVPENVCAGCGQPSTRKISYEDGPQLELCENDACERVAMDKWTAEQAKVVQTQSTVDATFNGHLNGDLIPRMSELPSAPLGPYGSLTALSLPDDLSYDEWASIGKNQIQAMGRASMWWLGDYLAYGDRKFGQTWAQIADELGYAEQTVKNAKQVCENIPPEERFPDLFFAHHQEVAFLGPKGRQKWLQLALDNKWTKGELRDAIRESRAGTTRETEPGKSNKGRKDKPPTAAQAVEGMMTFGRSIWEVSPDAALFNDWLGRINLLIEAEQWDWDTFDSLFAAMIDLRDKLNEKLREAVDVQKYRDVNLVPAESEKEAAEE